jgi:hypothetical protein
VYLTAGSGRFCRARRGHQASIWCWRRQQIRRGGRGSQGRARSVVGGARRGRRSDRAALQVLRAGAACRPSDAGHGVLGGAEELLDHRRVLRRRRARQPRASACRRVLGLASRRRQLADTETRMTGVLCELKLTALATCIPESHRSGCGDPGPRPTTRTDSRAAAPAQARRPCSAGETVGHVRRAHQTHRALPCRSGPGSAEGVEGGVAGVGQGVQVLLGSAKAAVAEAFFDDLDVGAAGEEPGGVGVA